MSVKSYRDLEVWQLSVDLAKRVYTATMCLPWPHRGEIGSQMRRSSVSAPSNIAEGFRQGSPRAYLRHVRIAAGSVAELETQAQLASELGLWMEGGGGEIQAQAARIGRMLTGLAMSLEARVLARQREL